MVEDLFDHSKNYSVDEEDAPVDDRSVEDDVSVDEFADIDVDGIADIDVARDVRIVVFVEGAVITKLES